MKKLTDRQAVGRMYVYNTAIESIHAYEPDPESDYYKEEMEQKDIVIRQIIALKNKFLNKVK